MILGWAYRDILLENFKSFYFFIIDRDQIKNFIISFGAMAPLVFIIIQILQVIFAPFPGEATGFIGGYLFGATKGFLYSSAGLAAGSCINFLIGRLLGIHYLRKIIPLGKLKRFDTFTKNNGLIIILILFIFPGFPKDYFCLFLGISKMPFKLFIMPASIGRMPGTLLLSLHGAFLFEKNYLIFALIAGLCLILFFFTFRYRKKIYQWAQKK